MKIELKMAFNDKVVDASATVDGVIKATVRVAQDDAAFDLLKKMVATITS